MERLLGPLLAYLSVATDRELARQVQYLKEENRILRDRLPARIMVTANERRRLLKFGKGLGKAINELITIVTPATFARWLSGELRKDKAPARQSGRPRTAADVRDLVVRLATENAWGYTRILGELKKLGIRISRTTVIAILKEQGFEPGPKRGAGTWSDFVRRHAATLWACDFFSKKVWTSGGLVDVFVLFFIHVQTRRVHVAGLTTNPDSAWMMQQAISVSTLFAGQAKRPKSLIMDLDTCFSANFRNALENDGVEIIRVGPCKPNLNAHAERFVQTIRRECLDHFVCFGIEHLRHIVTEFEAHYNQHRPHQALDNRPIPDAEAGSRPHLPFPSGDIACDERLGGLLKHYHRQAA
jgi:putative transposase